MTSTRNNPVTSALAGRGKGHGFAVPNPGLSTVGSLGDAVAAGTTGGVEVGDYNFVTLFLSNTAAGGTVAPQGSPGAEPNILQGRSLSPFVPLTNSEVGVGAVALVDLVYTYTDDTSITIPVKGVKTVRFVLTGGAADIRYTLHS